MWIFEIIENNSYKPYLEYNYKRTAIIASNNFVSNLKDVAKLINKGFVYNFSNNFSSFSEPS